MREKSSNAAYAVRQLYQKHLLGYEQQCTQRAEGSKRKSRETSPTARNKLDEMVAAANGTPDMELLGAVAALMEVPATERAANKRLKLDASGVSYSDWIHHAFAAQARRLSRQLSVVKVTIARMPCLRDVHTIALTFRFDLSRFNICI